MSENKKKDAADPPRPVEELRAGKLPVPMTRREIMQRHQLALLQARMLLEYLAEQRKV